MMAVVKRSELNRIAAKLLEEPTAQLREEIADLAKQLAQTRDEVGKLAGLDATSRQEQDNRTRQLEQALQSANANIQALAGIADELQNEMTKTNLAIANNSAEMRKMAQQMSKLALQHDRLLVQIREVNRG